MTLPAWPWLLSAGVMSGGAVVALGFYTYFHRPSRPNHPSNNTNTKNDNGSVRSRGEPAASGIDDGRPTYMKDSQQQPLPPSPSRLDITDEELDAVPGLGHNPDSAEMVQWVDFMHAVCQDLQRKDGCEHRGITCNQCGMTPIRGCRYKCANCIDYDICEQCENDQIHWSTHVFIKIRIPIPPLANPRSSLLMLLYPGSAITADTPPLALETIRRLERISHWNEMELRALYDEFRSLAFLDPRTGRYGIPRRSYDQCLGPLGVERNLIAERMFFFYDQDRDEWISFEEMVQGLAILTKGTLEQKIRYAFEGYDLDGDRHISRTELRKMFKAYFQLNMELVRDVVRGLEEEMMENFDANSNKPVSAVFTAPIPTEEGLSSSSPSSANANMESDPSPVTPGRLSAVPETSHLINTVDTATIPSSSSMASRRRSLISASQFVQQRLSLTDGPDSAEDGPAGGLWSFMESISQDAIEDMVERSFSSMDRSGLGSICYEDFHAFAVQDPTMISWFEALGQGNRYIGPRTDP